MSGEDWFLEDHNGRKFFPSETQIQEALKSQTDCMVLDIQYIGQAFGNDGSRTAIDRLRKHEKLQEISLKGAPAHHQIYLFMLGIQTGNAQMFLFNPFAENTKDGSNRIDASLDKLFNTTEAERTTLFEASLIRYFKPKYNIAFKESFPSSNLKVLQDCYKKDLAGVCAEINFDHLPFSFKSDHVPAEDTVLAYFDLHNADDRKLFFFDHAP